MRPIQNPFSRNACAGARASPRRSTQLADFAGARSLAGSPAEGGLRIGRFSRALPELVHAAPARAPRPARGRDLLLLERRAPRRLDAAPRESCRRVARSARARRRRACARRVARTASTCSSISTCTWRTDARCCSRANPPPCRSRGSPIRERPVSRAIDYRLSDPRLDPDGFERHYSERTLRLPDTFWCYDPRGDERQIEDLDGGELPAIERGIRDARLLQQPVQAHRSHARICGAA